MAVIGFKSPQDAFGNVDCSHVSRLAAEAADISLVIAPDGRIVDMAVRHQDFADELGNVRGWIGQPWTATVTSETRLKIDALLRDAASGAPSRWREANHPSNKGQDVPVNYMATRLDPDGRILALGRDLRPLSRLQQELVAAQLAAEDEFGRLRLAETRNRMLFEQAADILLVVDAVTHKIIEVNASGRAAFDDLPRGGVGRLIGEAFSRESATEAQALLGALRLAGRTDPIVARLRDGAREVSVTATLLREGKSMLALMRLLPVSAGNGSSPLPADRSVLLDLAIATPDAIIVADEDWRIISANAAFLEIAHLATEQQARGERLDRWIGRPGADLSLLAAHLRQRGSVRVFATALTADHGPPIDVEIAAVALRGADGARNGLTIRIAGRRAQSESKPASPWGRSPESLAELVGRVSLKEIVRETTDAIEKLYIETALQVTGDNRASAAEMLGLSRQSLYVKLRRYGIADDSGEDES